MDDDLQAQALESANKAVLGALGMQKIEEVATQFAVYGTIAQQMISDDEQLVSGRDNRLFYTVLGGAPVEVGG